MQRSLDHVTALREIGRHGDFGRIDGLRKQYKRSARSPPSRCHPLPQALALLARHISVSCELGLKETTEPTGGTQKGEYWGGPTNGQAAPTLLLNGRFCSAKGE